MDTMAKKGEITQQQVNDSSSMSEETVLQARSDGQTASTSHLTRDIKKEKENEVDLNTDDLKSNYRESDSVLGGDQRSNETSSSNCNKEERNTEKHELTKVIQQVKDSITRLNVQQARRDDETESIKQQITRIDDELTEVQKENKANYSVCDFIKRFAESSTIHGLPRLAAKGRIWRIFWSILLLGALAIAILQIANLFMDYYKYPVYFDVSIHLEYPKYPQITVCMREPFKSSAVKLHPVSRNYSDVWQLKDDIYDLPVEDRIKLGYEASEMMIARFTSDDEIFELKPTLVHHPYWGNCYAFTPPYGTRRVSVKFNFNFNERLDEYDSVYGYVFLTQVGIYPLDFQHDILIEPYTEVKSTFQLEEVSTLNDKYGRCQDDEEIFKKRTGFVYTRSLCLKECGLKNAQMKCDCVHVLGDLPPGFKSPEVSNSRECASDNERNCAMKAYYSRMNCQCKPMCRKSVYSLTTIVDGMQDDPGKFANWHDRFFNSSCNNCTDWAQNNFALFELNVVGKHYKEFKQKPLYPLPRFMSDIGGTLGLYVGASVLTLFELIHMLSGLIRFLLKRRSTE